MEKISFNKFVKLLTSQPYFVWNNNFEKEIMEDDEIEFDIFSYEDVAETSIQEIQAKSFNIIEKKFKKKVIENLSKIHFITSKSIENKIKETIKAMEDKNVENIINPVFSFDYKKFKVLAQPKIFFKNNKEISFFKISTSTKLKDILRFMFDYMVMQEIGINIKDASLYVLKTQDYTKGEVNFYKTKYINTSKSTRSVLEHEKYNYELQQLEKTGQGIYKNDEYKEKKSIFEILKSGKIIKSKNSIVFKSLNLYLDSIIKAKESQEIIFPTDEDASIFSDNLNWNLIMENTNNRWLGYSGKLISKKTIIANTSNNEILKNSIVVSAIEKNQIKILDKAKIWETLIEMNKKIVWYDFEAISLPFSPMDHILPFNQVVSQVSIIKTNNFEEKEVTNIVLDPKAINYHDFKKIIDAIYHEGSKYVVYNKSYENTRLKEMVYILKINKHPKSKELSKKVFTIIKNTIDLADYFICSKNKMPMILIPFLKGRYSIKIIEQYISKGNYNLPYKIKEYKNLKIQNGMMAMEIANNRALGILGNNQWNNLQYSLKEYCENDVRAMIMVYYLIKNILEKNKI